MDSLLTPQAGDSQEAAERMHEQRRAAYLAIVMGILHAALFLFSYWLLARGPGPRQSSAQIAAFYSDAGNRHLVLAGLYLMPFAGIAFIWFIVSLRMWITGHARRENVLLSNIQLVSGILYIAMFFATGAASSATAASVEFSSAQPDPAIVRQFPQFGYALLFVFAMRMAAMFVFTTSSIGRSAHALPNWFAFAGYAVGLFLLLSATFSPLLVLIFPVWLLVLCALLIGWVRALSANATPSPRASRAPSEQVPGEHGPAATT